MAYDFEAAKNSLDVLNEVFQAGSAFSDVSKIITVSGTLATAIQVVGAILGLIGGLRPDGKHEIIIKLFHQLDYKIDLLSGDIEQMKREIMWELTVLQYSDHVDRIQLGMKFCLAIGKARDEEQRKKHQIRLKELCAGQKCLLSLNAILDGMTGSSSILDRYYDKTWGHQKRISVVGTRLLQLSVGGMMVVSTYESLIHGKNGTAPVLAILKLYHRRLNEADNEIKSVLNRCVREFSANMLHDLNVFLDRGGSNCALVATISAIMSNKYDWLETYCLVFTDIKEVAKHYSGDQVSSQKRNGKTGIVFYRTKGEAPQFSNRYDEVYQIVKSVYPCDKANNCHNDIEAKTRQRGIQLTGCAVIKGDTDLCTAGSFSTRIILVDKPHTIHMWSSRYNPLQVKGKAIALLK